MDNFCNSMLTTWITMAFVWALGKRSSLAALMMPCPTVRIDLPSILSFFTHIFFLGLMSFFCPCFSFAQVIARLGWYDYTITLIVLAICFATGFLSIFGLIALFFTRNKMREVFKIPGTPVMDCIETFFCGCCSLAQMATHMGSYKKGDCNFNAPETLPGYKVV